MRPKAAAAPTANMPVPSSRERPMVGAAAALEVVVAATLAAAVEEVAVADALAVEELVDDGAVYLAGSSVPQSAASASSHAF